MKKAIIFYLWGNRNAGDMAICLGAISLLKELGYEITFVSRFAENQLDYIISEEYIKEYHDDIIIEPGLFFLDRFDSKIKKFFSHLKGLTKLISPIDDKRISQLIYESDIVFLNGGNLLRGNSLTDYARLNALFYPFRIARHLKKPMVCLPQSTAETNFIGLNILQNNLKKFKSVFIRENKSYSLFKKRLTEVNLIKSIDLAFFIKDKSIANEKYRDNYDGKLINKQDKNIAIVLRTTTIGDIGELSYEEKSEIENKIINLIKKMKNEYQIYFIIQTKKDKEFTYCVKKHLNNINEIRIIEEYDPYVIREIYKNMDFVIAMRLHAAILSLSVNTPVIGYFKDEWGLKNKGVMKDIGMMCTSDGENLIKMSREMILRRQEFSDKIKPFIDKERKRFEEELFK